MKIDVIQPSNHDRISWTLTIIVFKHDSNVNVMLKDDFEKSALIGFLEAKILSRWFKNQKSFNLEHKDVVLVSGKEY